MIHPIAICLALFIHWRAGLLVLVRANAGESIASPSASMAITTSNSMSVKAAGAPTCGRLKTSPVTSGLPGGAATQSRLQVGAPVTEIEFCFVFIDGSVFTGLLRDRTSTPVRAKSR
jgi:hypothetical protein